MAEPKGDKLFVNLAAAQARRRLKEFGHGVRKIQSAGRNQAVVIHTATGRNLYELEQKFADVGAARSANELSDPIENLRNLGPTGAAWLRDVGIRTIAELRQFGPAVAYRRVKQQHRDASLNLLWAIAAGLMEKDWQEISDDEKDRLRNQLAEL